MKVILLRHGQTPYNADGNRYCGRTDLDLTELGYEQAKKVQELIKDVELKAVYSSPLKRACITAAIVSGGKQVITDDRLIEIDFGTWEGLTKEVFLEKDPDSWANWMKDPANARAGNTGENGQDVVDRATDFYNEIYERHREDTILVVGHNGINRLFMASKLGMPLSNYRCIDQENASITLLEFTAPDTVVLRKLNADSL